MLSVHKAHDPLIKFLVEEMGLQGMSQYALYKQAGLAKDTIAYWRRGGGATISNFDAALNVLGYRLAIVDALDREVVL